MHNYYINDIEMEVARHPLSKLRDVFFVVDKSMLDD